MIIRELFEAKLPWQTASQLKEKRLRALLTPEVVAANHDLLIHFIGSKITLGEIDTLAAHLKGNLLDRGDVDEVLNVMEKMLKFADAFRSGTDLQLKLGSGNPALVYYHSGKWQVEHRNRTDYSSTTKKFDEPEEVVDYIKKRHALELKRDAIVQELDAASLKQYEIGSMNLEAGRAYGHKNKFVNVFVMPTRIALDLMAKAQVGVQHFQTTYAKTAAEAITLVKQHLGVK